MAALDTYLENSATKDNSSLLIDGLLKHIRYYVDTANKKNDRIEALTKATVLLEYMCGAMPVSDDPGIVTTYKAFSQILTKCRSAIEKTDNLIDFSNEIGFLVVLQGINTIVSS